MIRSPFVQHPWTYMHIQEEGYHKDSKDERTGAMKSSDQ